MISRLLTHPIQRTRKHIASDPQRSRLYKLEREFVGTSVYHQVSQRNLQVLANHVCAYYRVKPLKVITYHNPHEKRFGESISYSRDDFVTQFGEKIRLNSGYHGANLSTLLHELSHYISDLTYQNHRDHGKQFCGIYMHLLDKYRVLPASAFRLMAQKWRISIAGRFKPGAIRG